MAEIEDAPEQEDERERELVVTIFERLGFAIRAVIDDNEIRQNWRHLGNALVDFVEASR